jgi:hypothetical protein
LSYAGVRLRSQGVDPLTNTTRILAANLGVSVTNLLQAKTVIEAGDSEPGRYGFLAKGLDPKCVEAVRMLQARFGAVTSAPPESPPGSEACEKLPLAPKKARGLSKRQRDILVQGRLAHCNRNGSSDRAVDLYYRELHAFELQVSTGKNGDGEALHGCQVETEVRPCKSVANSIGRSVRNLEERGLVRRVKSTRSEPAGLLLTDAGRALAEELEQSGGPIRPLQLPLGVAVQASRSGSG